jgi:hypothetical protein
MQHSFGVAVNHLQECGHLALPNTNRMVEMLSGQRWKYEPSVAMHVRYVINMTGCYINSILQSRGVL